MGPRAAGCEFEDRLRSTAAHTGETLAQISGATKTLVVFLRHGGCTFCREALEDLRRDRSRIESEQTRIVLVHMMTDEEAGALFSRYGLADVARISDPDRALYRAFGLRTAPTSHLFNWKLWWRGLTAGIIHRHGAGRAKGDRRQMPGVFLLYDGEILNEFRHDTAADRPEYSEIASCDVGASTASE